MINTLQLPVEIKPSMHLICPMLCYTHFYIKCVLDVLLMYLHINLHMECVSLKRNILHFVLLQAGEWAMPHKHLTHTPVSPPLYPAAPPRKTWKHWKTWVIDSPPVLLLKHMNFKLRTL